MSEAELTPAAVAPRFAVRCDSWREFAERYADDIASGGMYLSHAVPPALLSLIDVVLQLPEATEISLRARVVQVLAAEQAASMGKQAGMGLELLDIDPERKRQIMQLIEFARWQGSSNDPKSSFARTLLELSPSMAPAEVGYRLSMLPDANKARSDSRPSIPAQPAAAPRAPSATSSQRAEAAAAALRRSLTPPGGRSAVREANVPRRPESAPLVGRASSIPPPRSSPPQPMAAGQASPRGSASKTGRSGAGLPAVRERALSSPVLPAADGGGERPSRAPAPAQPPKPTDKVKLKLVLTHVAHKHYEEAIRAAREMLDDNPGDPEALSWQALSCARLALQREDEGAALTYYEQIVRVDPEHREAREFIRTHQRDKKLNSIPFGRYFTTKKK